MADTDQQQKLKNICENAIMEIENTFLFEELNNLRIKYLGKKGEITAILKSLGELSSEERPIIGQIANDVRKKIEQSLNLKYEKLEKENLGIKLKNEFIDITLPGKKPRLGKKHVISQMIDELIQVFIGLGYKVAEGPEVELDYYNFEALNTPQDHPARSLQDTFYIESETHDSLEKLDSKNIVLLRTHTSPVQIRVMESMKPPLYIIAPGRAYRRDVSDPTHSPIFHQVEGFVVDKHITFGDLKGTLEVFAHEIFGKDKKVRLRPHFFPFTEPSAEVDVSCVICSGKGCRVCKGSGWLEILGAGMIDPNVLKTVGYDPEEVSGFAFGMGVERITMLKYGINDLRLFFENDLRFIEQVL